MHHVINKILDSRGYTSQESKDEFFSSNLNDLPNLTEMKDMGLASKRIVDAILNNEKIGIYGDYDVDGTTSCALFYQFFKMFDMEVELIQPSRFIEGYGVHNSSIDKAVNLGVNVLITVDCGITNHETAKYAKDKLDLIITDHHKGKETNPEAYAVVNPNRADETDSPLKSLAGVGVAFAVCLAVKKELEKNNKHIPSIYPLLQYVAVGTISDLATLTPMNLKLVRHGLKQISNSKYKGLKAFFSDKDLKEGIRSEQISFMVGPMINSIGRLDHPDLALRLLITNSDVDAMKMFTKLHKSNQERKEIQRKVEKEAQAQINRNLTRGNASLNIVYKKDWHEGVIGIAASKLVQNNRKPAIVFTDAEEDGIIKASCRSVGKYDLFTHLKDCSDLFEKFGGHKAAAGLSMKKDNLPKLRRKLNKLMKGVDFNQIYKDNQDLFPLNTKDVSLYLAKSLDTLEPFGMGNPNPVFCLNSFEIVNFTVLKETHVKWTLRSKEDNNIVIEAISFNFINQKDALLPEEYIKIQSEKELSAKVNVKINKFRNQEKVQLFLEEIF